MAKPAVSTSSIGPRANDLVRDTLYTQLSERLTALLRGGSYGPGERFLTEREVAERFAVSRPTANKALSHLVVSGALELRKGVGTFVRQGPLTSDLRSLVSFTGHAERMGRVPSTKVLSFSTRSAAEVPASVREQLAVAPTERLYAVERLRLADGEPVILERRHLVERLCPGLDRRKLAGSLYSLLVDTLGLEIAGATQSIEAVRLKALDARLLGTSPGAPALLLRGIGYGKVPIWAEETLYRGDKYVFVNTLGSVPSRQGSRAQLMLVDRERS